MANPSGWYPDPDGKPCERFWNGYKWTNKTRPISKPAEEYKVIQKMDEFNKGLEKWQKAKINKSLNMTVKEREAVIASNKKTMKNFGLFGCLPITLLFVGFVWLGSSGENKTTTSPKKDTTTISTPEPTKEKDLRKDAAMGGFVGDDLQKIKEVRESLYGFLFTWSGLVAGTSTYAEVSINCSNLEDANNYIRGVDSYSPYFEDLLDRAKDYLYETRSECEYAFKKNRLEDLGQSAENAGIGIGFFDRIISESENNKVAPKTELDLMTKRSCEEWSSIIRDATTEAEVRTGMQRVYETARYSVDADIVDAATRQLAALTAKDIDAWDDASYDFGSACKAHGAL